MKRFIIAAVAIACLSTPAFAAEQAMFKKTGSEAERALVTASKDFADNIKAGVVDPAQIGIATLDVNGDGVKEIFVHDYNSFSCGSAGCATYIYRNDGGALTTLMYVIAGDTIAVSDNAMNNNGYKDIYIKGGDGAPIRWTFDGKQYVFNN